MTLGRHIESRGILSLLPRLSLRAKGVAALAVPMAALFAALFGIYWAEQAAHLADQATVRAHDTQIELLQLRIIMLDTGSAISDYLATGELLTVYNVMKLP